RLVDRRPSPARGMTELRSHQCPQHGGVGGHEAVRVDGDEDLLGELCRLLGPFRQEVAMFLQLFQIRKRKAPPRNRSINRAASSIAGTLLLAARGGGGRVVRGTTLSREGRVLRRSVGAIR